MWAIYKKECRSYFHNMTGFLFMGFLLVIAGIYTVALNLVNGFSNFEYVLSSIAFIMIILIPLLTMRIIAEEKKQKTEQLLYTAPLSVERIVFGKYLATLTVFALPMLLTLLYPVLLGRFGEVNYASAYGGIIGFFFMGAAYIAIGVWISSFTESQVIAAVISFLVFLLTYLTPSIADMIPADKTTSLIVLYALALLAAWLLYFLTRSYLFTILTAILGAGGITVLYFIKAEWFDGLIVKIMNSAALISRFDNFTFGMLDLSGICYYLTIIVLFLFLSIALIKHSFTPKSLKNGAYHAALVVFTAAAAILINLVVGKLGIQLDLSADNMYTLTEETKELLNGIDDKVTIYYVVQDGKENAQIANIVKQYNGMGNVTVVEKDPVLHPSFTAEYTADEVQEESIIVENETTNVSKYIPYMDMLVTEMDYMTYNYNVTAIDVEGQITSAVRYVTAKERAKLYTVTGHGEAALPETVLHSIRKLNMEQEEIQTLTVQEIPEDCSILFVNSPVTDFTKEETELIRDYLKKGGKAILNTGYTDNAMEHYNSLLNDYGVSQEEGVIFEEAGNYAGNYPTYLVPDTQAHEITDGIDKYLVLPVCRGIVISEDLRDGLTVESLLQTSGGAYSKVNMDSETIGKEDGDVAGPFSLGAAITEENEGMETKIVTFSSGYLLDETFITTGQFGNERIFLNALTWLADMENGSSIPARNISQTYLSVTAPQAVLWGTILVIVLPLALIITGLAIWLKRRKN